MSTSGGGESFDLDEVSSSSDPAVTAAATEITTAAAAAAAAADQDILSCRECGRDVPAANLVLHEATCSRIRSNQGRPSSQPQPTKPSHPEPLQCRLPAPAAREREPPSQQEPSQPEDSGLSETQPLLPQLERGQTTLDRWLATASSSSRGGTSRSSRIRNGGVAAAERSPSNENGTTASSLDSNAVSSDSNALSSNSAGDGEDTVAISLNNANAVTSNSAAAAPGPNSASADGGVAGGAAATSASNSDEAGTSSLAVHARGNAGADNTSAPYSSHAYSQATRAPLAAWNAEIRMAQTSSANVAEVVGAGDDGPAAGRPPADAGDSSYDHGWRNIAYNPQFRRDRDGITRVEPNHTFIDSLQNNIQSLLPLNPLVHGGPLGTVVRVLNGLMNGAIVGFTLFDLGGLIVGAILGATGGIVVDRSRNADDQREERETWEVADMLAGDDGGIDPNMVRVHRGGGYITALASNSQGQCRIIRVRYGDSVEDMRIRRHSGLGPRPPETTNNRGNGGDNNNGNNVPDHNAELRRQVISAREDLERSLLEMLVQMSYSRDFGPGPGRNVILQPEESFEELVGRFGLGRGEERGASRTVIDSFPVEVVRRERIEGEGSGGESESDDENSEGSFEGSSSDGSYTDDDEGSDGESDDEDDMGTCGICLENYREGDLVKRLGCPNRPHCFHRDCIDKWLKVQANCPICKSQVRMYKGPAANSQDG